MPQNVHPTSAHHTNRSKPFRDVIWGRPIFRPPELINPRAIYEPQPFRYGRFTEPGVTRKDRIAQSSI